MSRIRVFVVCHTRVLGQNDGAAWFAKRQDSDDGRKVGGCHEIDPHREFLAMDPRDHDRLIAVGCKVKLAKFGTVLGFADNAVAEQIFYREANNIHSQVLCLSKE